MSSLVDMTGLRYGYFEVLHIERTPNERPKWRCRCRCGVIKVLTGYELRTGHTQSCGCKQRETYSKMAQIGVAMPASKPSLGGFHKLRRMYKRAARNRGHEYTLTDAQFRQLTSSDCVYCGSPPRRVSTYSKRPVQDDLTCYLYNGIDRIVSERGYVLDNCVTCCRTCNFLRQSLTVTEFLDQVRKISDFQLSLDNKKERKHV